MRTYLCAYCNVIGYITRCECFELFEKTLMVNVVRTITGKRHPNQTIYTID